MAKNKSGSLFEKEQVSKGFLKTTDSSETVPMVVEGYEDENMFLTGFNGSLTSNYQLNYALDAATVYYLSFGDRLSLFNISGIAFPRACDEKQVSFTPSKFVSFYYDHKISTQNPLRIVIADDLVIQGMFVSLGIDIVAGFERTYRFTFVFLGKYISGNKG